jgi:polyisoprenoid-binding protein YceI
MTTMTSVAAGTWAVGLAGTRAAFAARHMFGSTVHGTIAVTAGTIEVGTDGRPVRWRGHRLVRLGAPKR